MQQIQQQLALLSYPSARPTTLQEKEDALLDNAMAKSIVGDLLSDQIVTDQNDRRSEIFKRSGVRGPDASVLPTEHSYHRFLNKKINQALRENNGQSIDCIFLGDSMLSHIQRDPKLWYADQQ